jgi:hypothetical protein
VVEACEDTKEEKVGRKVLVISEDEDIPDPPSEFGSDRGKNGKTEVEIELPIIELFSVFADCVDEVCEVVVEPV